MLNCKLLPGVVVDELHFVTFCRPSFSYVFLISTFIYNEICWCKLFLYFQNNYITEFLYISQKPDFMKSKTAFILSGT